MGKLDDRVALVTGASQGIGLGIAQQLAVEGASLVLTARKAKRLSQNAIDAGEWQGSRCDREGRAWTDKLKPILAVAPTDTAIN